MKAEIKIKVGTQTFEANYIVGLTSAPRAYDYYGVIQVEEGDGRIVAIPEGDRFMQEGRYMSGLHSFVPLKEQDEPLFSGADVLVDMLVARLIK
jgi:hypothetical protein